MPAVFPASPLAIALNALLDRQPAAQARLGRHAGKTLCLALPLRSVKLTLDADSRFRPAAEAAAAALSLIPDPSALPRWLTGGNLADLFRVEGDGELAADIAGVLAGFDWVLALRPYLGDIAASRVDQLLQGIMTWRHQALEAAGRNLAEYAVYEQAVLAEPLAAREFIAAVDRLREDADRLEARLKALETHPGPAQA